MDRGAHFIRSAGPRHGPQDAHDFAPPSRITLFLRRAFVRLSKPPFRRLGSTLLLALFLGTGGYGAARGGHVAALAAAMQEAGDALARGFGFGIVQVEVRGARTLADEEILARAGVTEQSSLLFLSADHVRDALRSDPRIAKARVRKLYPDRLDIVIEEREPIARWQRAGKLHLIASDGAVLASDIGAAHADLPLVVGAGAAQRAAAFLELIARFPSLREAVRAGVLVAERRWNLRLRNGIDVRLPEEDPAQALKRLVQLDAARELLSRDLSFIDLRTADRVSVGLSEEAVRARKEDAQNRKGAES
jgi:cell division protein FtsQ